MTSNRRITTLELRIDTEIQHKGLTPKEAYRRIREEFELMGLDGDVLKDLETAYQNARARLEAVERLTRENAIRTRRAPWYTGPNADAKNWSAYREYLVDKGWGEAIDSIDTSSTQVVSMLYNPGTPRFESRGLVLGYVQSGKTANMTAVIAKAADAGYKLVIILTGMIEKLRQQTQARLESDLTSREGAMHWDLWTTVDEDFTAQPTFPGFQFDAAHRNIMVVKKQKHVLERIIDKLSNTASGLLNNLPVLVIDDECDQASVNASGRDNETSTLNRLIREIMEKFPRHSYIGYTATPFANVLIDPEVKPNEPLDLYPKDFIYTLPLPEHYFGAERLFGRDLLDADETLEDDEELDVIRTIPPEEAASLSSGSSDSFFEMADSAEAALDYFLIATAVRIWRGQPDKHSTMLYHTSHLRVVHYDIAEAVRDALKKRLLLLKRGSKNYLKILEAMYSVEHAKVPPALYGYETPAFAELIDHIRATAEKSQVVVINSVSEDRLDYDTEGGQRYIVIGGNVISRGLTLEGLVSSFFMRTSRQYDTLMQMGRWFGYRPGYEDLPRVWMTREMQDIFTSLATVEADIREKIRVYEQEEPDITPLDVAVRIRQIPGLAITARNKMRNARRCHFSFAGEHRQTIHFAHKNLGILQANWSAAEALIESAIATATPEERPRGWLLRDVDRSLVEAFLHAYSIHPTHADLVDHASGQNHLLNYIHKRRSQPTENLKLWNVGILHTQNPSARTANLAGIGDIGLITRSMFQELANGDADIKSLMSRQDIGIDVATPIPNDASWAAIKGERRKSPLTDRALLLLYPIDKDSEPVRRRVGRNGEAIDSKRRPLGASMHVMGMGILFPSSDHETEASHYVEVVLPTLEDAYDDAYEEEEEIET